ncbi:LPXTG cell wall anchor domain-containing protein [Streptococcus suis]|uniref:LPXTG cell wall anchor domain-containing protein n=1 Tax=Streptococcus suis TaxID=1307 RepID=UPI0027413D1C
MSEEGSTSHSESISLVGMSGKQLQRSGILPNTGEESSAWTSLLGAFLLIGGLFKRRKKRYEDESGE